jgi:cytochrome c-type biogenesis protein CcmH
MSWKSALLTGCFALALSSAALAIAPDEMLADPVLEARAREVGKDLRCLVCQNQSIDDSDAELARDLRRLLRQRLLTGDSDVQARDYIVARYGDYVLLKPPFKAATLPLWLGPFFLLAAGGLAVVAYFRRRGRETAASPAALDADERHRLASLLGDEEIS